VSWFRRSLVWPAHVRMCVVDPFSEGGARPVVAVETCPAGDEPQGAEYHAGAGLETVHKSAGCAPS